MSRAVAPPRRAMLLAAGFGTRLLPLTRYLPKPLLPVRGRPLIDHALDTLAGWGVREVLVNLHHGADRIFDHLRRRPSPLRLHFSYEPEILGTGGALARAAWFLTEPFWLVNADIVFAVPPAPFRAALRDPRTLAALWLCPDAGPRTVETADGHVRRFRAATPGAPGTATFCGLHLVRPRLLEYIGQERFGSVIAAYEAAMRQGERIAAVTPAGARWIDAGTPEALLAANRRTPADHPVVLLPGARLGPRARARDAILAPGVSIARGPVTGVVCPAADFAEPRLLHAVTRLCGAAPDTAVAAFPPRGSARRFFRVHRPDGTRIVILYEHTRPENRRFAAHARFLSDAGIPVPAIHAEDRRRRILMVEDIGDDSYESLITEAGRAPGPLYARLLPVVARLHTTATRLARARAIRMEPAFTPALYAWEHALFLDRFLVPIAGARPAARRAIGRELAAVAGCCREQEAVLIHRDLQSSNVYLRRGEPVLIDFQGMRYGPALYDLAALLCDPYVSLAHPLILDLVDRYAALRALDPAVTRAVFWPAAIQRLGQALGAFGRFAADPATRRFARHIPPAVRMLRWAATQHGRTPRLQAALDDYLRAAAPGKDWTG